MTLATLPDLSKITSLMSPIFSFASLYTSIPASLDARHSPSLCVVALVVDSAWFVAVCADAAPFIHTVASNAIARHLEIMMFLHVQRPMMRWDFGSSGGNFPIRSL